jgi:hypothetical protein
LTVQLGAKKPNGFVSFLDHLGHIALTGLDKALPFLVGAAPVVAAVGLGAGIPVLGPIYNTTLAMIVQMEAQGKASAASATQQGLTNQQKMAGVLTTLWPMVQELLKKDGISADLSQYNVYVNGIVAELNAFAAPVGSPALTAGTPVVAVASTVPQ